MFEYVCNRVFIERRDERGERLVQYPFQGANGGDRACVGLRVKAFSEPEIRLRLPDHIAETNEVRLARKRYTTRAARMNSDEAIPGESVNHSHQVIFRDAVRAANLLRRHNTVRVRPQINKNAKSVITV
jgi:hypothetical protein